MPETKTIAVNGTLAQDTEWKFVFDGPEGKGTLVLIPCAFGLYVAIEELGADPVLLIDTYHNSPEGDGDKFQLHVWSKTDINGDPGWILEHPMKGDEGRWTVTKPRSTYTRNSLVP